MSSSCYSGRPDLHWANNDDVFYISARHDFLMTGHDDEPIDLAQRRKKGPLRAEKQQEQHIIFFAVRCGLTD